MTDRDVPNEERGGPVTNGESDAGAAPTQDVLVEADRLIRGLQAHSDPAVREQIDALLQRIDVVHRLALTRLVGAIQAMAGEAFMNRLTADPAIRLLLMSYDLIAIDRRILAEEALDRIRGPLHRRGIDVELQDVVGGAVYVRLHGVASARVTEERIRQDVEHALREGLVGFQQLELRGRDPAAGGALVQLGERRVRGRPRYRFAACTADLPAGSFLATEVEGLPVLLANIDGDVLAVRNQCGDTPLPLHFGTLEGSALRCSWHGCLYDLRTGRRVDGGIERLHVLPVATDDDAIRVAVGVEPAAERNAR